jgi:hypothetical protein
MIEDRPACEQAPALAAGRHCNALNHNAGSLQKVINIARRFTPSKERPALQCADRALQTVLRDERIEACVVAIGDGDDP